ncbi:helix-turn-helix transcriptional regulator [Ottowia sp. VDI28]|uniref:helix-turn-helix transcriptional regulator n=1 Tax=Ottowia sp. VDI28 TaxID=3133968 RepID=UPI003C30D2A0
MTASPVVLRSTLLASSDFAAHHRVAALREFFGREVMRADFWSHDNACGKFDFRTRITSLGLGTVYVHAHHTPTHLWRSPALMQDGCDDVLLYACSSGLLLRAPSYEMAVPAGSVAIVSKAREYQGITPRGGPSVCLQVPHRHIARLAPGLEAAPLRVLLPGTPGAALALAYAELLSANPALPAAQQFLATTHLHELMASALVSAHRPGITPPHEAHAPSRLALIRRDMQTRLGQPSLTLEAMARRHGLTPRQIQRLFAAEGTCFSDELRAARLERAHALLTDPAKRHLRMVDIALDCGFAEASTFNRAFRRRFGAAPSSLR